MTKKQCASCGKRGKTVVARESNTGRAAQGERRCICRSKKGCRR